MLGRTSLGFAVKDAGGIKLIDVSLGEVEIRKYRSGTVCESSQKGAWNHGHPANCPQAGGMKDNYCGFWKIREIISSTTLPKTSVNR